MNARSSQLALKLQLRDNASFDSYHAGPNAMPAAQLRALAAAPYERPTSDQIYLWGAQGTGKSHLLRAACRAVAERGETCAYLPLGEPGLLGGPQPSDASALNDLGSVALVCVDDLDIATGRPAWEEGLFHMINAVRASGHRLALASRGNPAHLGLRLPDLSSRLLAGPVFRLQPLDDNAKLAALTARAAGRGLELPETAGRYLLNNCRRDLGFLLRLLDHLDTASLAAQRRITVPFIKSVLMENTQGI